MNTQNETVVSPKMMEQLRKAGLDGGYRPVPKRLLREVNSLLLGRQIASMDPEFKRKLRNRKKAMRRAGVAGY